MTRRCPLSARAMGSIALLALLGLLPLHATAQAAPGAPARVVYTSPVAGARYVRTGTTLIARFDRALDGPVSTLPAFTVVGTVSGSHAGRTLLADGGRALLFRPAVPFADGEQVTVTLTGGALGDAATRTAFSTAAVAAAPLSAT